MKPYTFRDWLKSHEDMYWHTWLRQVWYYLQCRWWRKHNVIRIKTLPPTWRDADEKLLHASFAILCDVIEKEGWLESRMYEPDPSLAPWDPRDEWQEVATLYDWWKNVRPNRINPYDWAEDERKRLGIEHPWELGQPMSAHELEIVHLTHEIDEGHHEEDTQMLARLMRIRRMLWT